MLTGRLNNWLLKNMDELFAINLINTDDLKGKVN